MEVYYLAARDIAMGKTPIVFPPIRYSEVELLLRQA